MKNKKSIGLPSGPNEFLKDITQHISVEGYKRYSEDVNNPYNIIESSNITMEDVDFPVRGYGNNGVVQDMTPGVPHYDYGNADYVVEVPMAQDGGDPEMISGDPEMIFKDEYNTALTKEETIEYEAWVVSESKRQGRDIMWDLGTYDIQGFWKSGDYMKMDEDNHGSDRWKKPNHPTFSNQSNYHNVDGYIGGTWAEDGAYTPAAHTRKLYDNAYYKKLFDEPGRIEHLKLEEKQKGGSLPKAQYGSNGAKGVKVDDDVVQNSFQYRWLNSPMYKEMLANEVGPNDDAEFITFGRRSNLDDVPIKMMEGKKEGDEGVAATSNRGSGRITFYEPSQDGLDEGYAHENTVEHEIGHSSDRVGEDTKEKYLKNLSLFDKTALANYKMSNMASNTISPNYVGLANKAYNFITGNETNSLQDRGAQIEKNLNLNRLIPEKTIQRFNDERLNIESYDEEGIPIINDYDEAYYQNYDEKGKPIVTYNNDGTIQEGSISIDKDSWADYVSKPTEARTRINTIRSAARDLGIYDPFTEKLTPEKFQELKRREFHLDRGEDNSYNALKQLQGIYSDDEIFDMLNTVSDATENISNKTYAKKGSELRKGQNGNGEYKVQKGDTFYGIANRNNVSWDTLKEANPNVNIESLGLNQKIIIPKAINLSSDISEDEVDNSKILDFNNISNYIVETRGGTKDTWGQLADLVAHHETGFQQRMDPLAIQISQREDGTFYDGPGRGVFQFEQESFDTALKRYKNIASAKGYSLKNSIVNATSADQLSSKDQYTLFLANLIESKAKLSDYANGKLSSLDVWLLGHKNVEAKGDRNSFLESKKAAEENGIENGYKTFQYGGEGPMLPTIADYPLVNEEEEFIGPYTDDYIPKKEEYGYNPNRQKPVVNTNSYIVKSGDNLSRIANKYKTSVDELIRLNDISDPNKISVNQELILPEIPENSAVDNLYKVKSGDTLGKIAKAYKTSVNKLATLNNIEDVNKININQELVIPDSYKERPFIEESWYDIDDIQKNNDRVNNLTDENIIINSQLLNNPNQSYVVIDKKTQRLKLYRGDEIGLDFEVLTGKNPGDAQTVTNVIDQNGDGIITDADKVNGNFKTDWKAGNLSTGAGIYTINQSSQTSEDRYQNAPSFNLLNESGIQVGTSIHGTPTYRNSFFDDGNLENNNASYGCINGKCSDLDALYDMNLPPGTPVYILPEDEGNAFQQVDGKAVMRMDSKNRENYLQYTDVIGNEQEGQGGNYSTSTLKYKPIRAKLDEKLFKEKVYTTFDFNDDKEFNNTTQPFISALVKNKKEIMKAAQIPGDVYNQIAKMAFGVYGTESNFGDTHSMMGNLGRAGSKYFDSEGSSSPDVVSKYDTYGVQGENNSVGYTQIRWSQLNDKEKNALKSFDIRSNKDFLNPEKSAIATATILGIRYNEQLTGEQKKNIWKYLPSKWNNRSNYGSRVKSNSRYLKLEQEDRLQKGGEVKNNIMYKNYINGVYTGSKMESKAEKVYDKLNRLHYRDAKAKQMTPANYVLSHIIG